MADQRPGAGAGGGQQPGAEDGPRAVAGDGGRGEGERVPAGGGEAEPDPGGGRGGGQAGQGPRGGLLFLLGVAAEFAAHRGENLGRELAQAPGLEALV